MFNQCIVANLNLYRNYSGLYTLRSLKNCVCITTNNTRDCFISTDTMLIGGAYN